MLAIVRNLQQHQTVTTTIFTAAAIVQHGPVRTRIEPGRKKVANEKAR
jgi:hypothetical protein